MGVLLIFGSETDPRKNSPRSGFEAVRLQFYDETHVNQHT